MRESAAFYFYHRTRLRATFFGIRAIKKIREKYREQLGFFYRFFIGSAV
jgi:hypothetical protein